MNEEKRISKESFQEKLNEAVAGVAEKKLDLNLRFLEEYCKFTDHDLSAYKSIDRVPLGFLMTFMGPSLTEMFFGLFSKHPNVLKGVIHTSSKVQVFAPLKMSAGRWRETLSVKNIEEKTGKKGNYFAVDFEMILTDDGGAKIASDVHQFFLKV